MLYIACHVVKLRLVWRPVAREFGALGKTKGIEAFFKICVTSKKDILLPELDRFLVLFRRMGHLYIV